MKNSLWATLKLIMALHETAGSLGSESAYFTKYLGLDSIGLSADERGRWPLLNFWNTILGI